MPNFKETKRKKSKWVEYYPFVLQKHGPILIGKNTFQKEIYTTIGSTIAVK